MKGFKEILNKGRGTKELKIRVIYVSHGQQPVIKEIPNTLTALQASVGGRIEFYPLGDYNSTSLIVNEEGKILSLPANAKIEREVINGNFLVVKRNKDFEIVSMPKKYAERIAKLFNLQDGEYRQAVAYI